jgi:hypothetical protein
MHQTCGDAHPPALHLAPFFAISSISDRQAGSKLAAASSCICVLG